MLLKKCNFHYHEIDYAVCVDYYFLCFSMKKSYALQIADDYWTSIILNPSNGFPSQKINTRFDEKAMSKHKVIFEKKRIMYNNATVNKYYKFERCNRFPQEKLL